MESPITQFCRETDLLPNELAGKILLSNVRYKLLEEGAFDGIPSTLQEFADEVRGPGGADRLEADYKAFRAGLDSDTRAELERQLYPAGRAYGMCP